MTKKEKPLHILGAGPAGLCAAIGLATAGREVHLHERYEVIGKRFQGDLQGLENWSLNENVLSQLKTFGLKIQFAATPFHEVTLTDGKTFFKKKSSEPLFYLVKRGPFQDSLDKSLEQQAKEAGVNIHYHSRGRQKADIVATGPLRGSLAAVDRGIVFAIDHPNIAVGIFHDELAYKGYSYFLVVDGYGCLCSVVFEDFHKLNGCFEKTVEMAQSKFKLNLKDAKPVGGVGGFSLNHPRVVDETLYVGESAGFQDLLWGFGIRTALTSGYLAAQAILYQQDYNGLVDQKLTPFLKASMVNRYLWEKMKIGKKPIIPMMLRLPIPVRGGFQQLYGFSFIHKMLYPFAEKYVKQHYGRNMDEKHIGEFNGISN
jgi:hypothetical protein